MTLDDKGYLICPKDGELCQWDACADCPLYDDEEYDNQEKEAGSP